MKKIFTVFLCIILLILSASGNCTYAAGAVSRGKASGTLKEVRFFQGENGEMVEITAVNYTDYNVMELTSPKRIVIDIFNLVAPGKQQIIETGGEKIKRIRYAQFDTYTARVVLEVNVDEDYGIEKTDKGLLVYFGEKPLMEDIEDESGETPADEEEAGETEGIKNIEYRKSGDRYYFILRGAVLTKGDKCLEELYTGEYDKTGKKYTITFPAGDADLGSGIMKINDNYVKSLEVKNNKDGTISLIFTASGKNTYFVFTRDNSQITSITVLKPAADSKKLVVIDAGHGDSATGAIYKNLKEKDLNLDIAKRLNTLLKKKGVNTYMLRDDDSYIANYERAYIANNMNAKLYLSIHNNATENKNIRGTMTLYYPSVNKGFTGKDLAAIVQKHLVNKLKTVDRKTISRPDLIVLRETNMPAALAEIAYLTNSTDRANLQKESFRQNAAQALCDSIIEALKKIK